MPDFYEHEDYKDQSPLLVSQKTEGCLQQASFSIQFSIRSVIETRKIFTMLQITTLLLLVPGLLGSAITEGPSVQTHHFELNEVTHHSLNLNELKLFTGHSLNLVKLHCPLVDPVKINRIQKYITKRIAHLNPDPQKEDPAFVNIMRTIKSCVKQPRIPGPGPASDENTSKNVKLLGPSLAELFGKSEDESYAPGPDAEAVIRIVVWPADTAGFGSESESESILVPILDYSGAGHAADLPELDSETAPKEQEHNQASTSEPGFAKFAEYEAEYNPIPIPTEYENPIPIPIQTEYEYPTPIQTDTDTKVVLNAEDLPLPHFSLSSWVSDIWSSVRSFFQRTFGHFRHRRSPKEGVENPQLNGAQQFTAFFDEVCKIYCQCQEVTGEFKEAARDLLKFLFNDAKSLDQASGNLLDDELVQALHECNV